MRNIVAWHFWEDRMKYAEGLDALSGVKYDPSDIRQWCKVNDQKAHHQKINGRKPRNIKPSHRLTARRHSV